MSERQRASGGSVGRDENWSFSVQVLGCRAGRPDAASGCSGYLVTTAAGSVLVDCGPGVVAELLRQGFESTLSGVVLTHIHQDHMLDVVPLAFTRLLVDPKPARIPLWLPADSVGDLHALDALMAVPTDPNVGHPLRTAFDIRPLGTDGATSQDVLDGVTLTAYRARHAVPSASLAFVADGRRLAFSSDTGWCDGVLAAASGADLFFCEATYLEADRQALEEHGHLTASLTGELARAADVRHLVVTHLLDAAAEDKAYADARASAGDREVTLAKVGLTVRV